jgi:hypothetical protein
VLQSITIPPKNFFLSHLSLASACSPYQFQYHSHKTPLCSVTGTLLNCKPDHREIHCSVNSLFSIPPSSSSIMLNCRTLWAYNGMPSGLCEHLKLLRLLGQWTHDGMPSYLCRHLGHLSHLSYLSTLGNLNILNPYSLNTAPIDNQPKAFMTEMNSKDPGPSEGYFKDDSLNPLPMLSPLLLTPQEPINTLNSSLSEGQFRIRQIDA